MFHGRSNVNEMLKIKMVYVISILFYTFASCLKNKGISIMTFEEKVNVIDTNENKSVVAIAIANSILKKYGLENYNSCLDEWLYDNIMQSTLAEMLTNNQGMYVIPFAKKCFADIIYMRNKLHKSNLEIIAIVSPIADACRAIFDEYSISDEEVGEETLRALENPNYEEMLILDDKLFVYTDNMTTDDVKRFEYHVFIHVGYHPNYTLDELKARIGKRLLYKRDPNEIAVTFVDESETNVGFDFVLRITDVLDRCDFVNAIKYRLGSTSGKPWYRCHVDKIQ